jgi:hypothetical protein
MLPSFAAESRAHLHAPDGPHRTVFNVSYRHGTDAKLRGHLSLRHPLGKPIGTVRGSVVESAHHQPIMRRT